MSKSMDFVRDFLKYFESQGIYDEYDKELNKMVTSAGVKALVEKALECLPAKLKPVQAANAMRDLTEEEKDHLILDAENDRVIDLRKQFQEKMSRNQGAQGIVTRLANAVDDKSINLEEILKDAQAFVNGIENVPVKGDK